MRPASGMGELEGWNVELGNEGRDGMEIEPMDPRELRELCGGPFMSNISEILGGGGGGGGDGKGERKRGE